MNMRRAKTLEALSAIGPLYNMADDLEAPTADAVNDWKEAISILGPDVEWLRNDELALGEDAATAAAKDMAPKKTRGRPKKGEAAAKPPTGTTLAGAIGSAFNAAAAAFSPRATRSQSQGARTPASASAAKHSTPADKAAPPPPSLNLAVDPAVVNWVEQTAGTSATAQAPVIDEKDLDEATKNALQKDAVEKQQLEERAVEKAAEIKRLEKAVAEKEAREKKEAEEKQMGDKKRKEEERRGRKREAGGRKSEGGREGGGGRK